ncbi:MAG: glycosyl transferase [Candidatus Binatia bacterium]|nr:MAG: glycosyl transferase [Candidatus Binatia bacterium]
MKRQLHVAYVCADRGVPVGGTKGASVHVAEFARALRSSGADVRILAARTTGNFAEVPVVDLGGTRFGREIRKALFERARTVRERAAATEVQGLLTNQILGRELERMHRKWGIDAVYERYSLWSYAAAAFAETHDIPYALEVNAPLRQEQERYRALENPAAAAGLESFLFRAADFVVVPSRALRPYVVRRGARRGAVRVLPNAADPDRFVPTLRSRKEGDEFVVGFLGSLKPWHGLETLVPAFAKLSRLFGGYRLLVVGDGPMKGELRKGLATEGLIGKATFAGEVPHHEVPKYLAGMDAGLAPYPKIPGFYFSPLKVFEYMGAGVPVVASRVGQLAEVLAHGRTALLHRPGSIDGMVRAIERLRSSPQLAHRLARNARSTLVRRFTWRRNAERVLAMFERHLPARRRRAGRR